MQGTGIDFNDFWIRINSLWSRSFEIREAIWETDLNDIKYSLRERKEAMNKLIKNWSDYPNLIFKTIKILLDIMS